MGHGRAAKPLEPRFSRSAMAGAIWAGAFFIAAFLTETGSTLPMSHIRSRAPPAWDGCSSSCSLFPVCSPPFGTTILGWIAVSQIRHSAGKALWPRDRRVRWAAFPAALPRCVHCLVLVEDRANGHRFLRRLHPPCAATGEWNGSPRNLCHSAALVENRRAFWDQPDHLVGLCDGYGDRRRLPCHSFRMARGH